MEKGRSGRTSSKGFELRGQSLKLGQQSCCRSVGSLGHQFVHPGLPGGGGKGWRGRGNHHGCELRSLLLGFVLLGQEHAASLLGLFQGCGGCQVGGLSFLDAAFLLVKSLLQNAQIAELPLEEDCWCRL
jgi:hypothetical protein